MIENARAALRRILDKARRSPKSARAFALFACAYLALIAIPLPDGARPKLSRTVVFEDGTLLRAYLTDDQKWRLPVVLSSLPAHLTEGLICLEDRRFRYHPGIDPIAAARAFRQNANAGRTVSGASTITMQVARLMDPKPRTWGAKLEEALRAIHLDAKLSKDELLGLYLTYAPFGANVEGIEAAAQRYFRKPASLLSPGEAAFLFLLPQAPQRWDKRPEEALIAMRGRVLDRWRDCGLLSEGDAKAASAERLPAYRAAFDEHSEHFADFVVKQPTIPGSLVKTTLSRDVQGAIESYVESIRERYREKGIRNVGIVVVDNETSSIKALVGNFKYHDALEEQKIASFSAFRSTGSLLKPVLYAKLIELGEMLPETLLEDVPLDIEGYDPKNYDGTFSGLVEAEQALAHSFNVPFVRGLQSMGLENFLASLFESGLKTNLPKEKLGLSAIIGGLQANLLDLTQMYTAFARNGRLRALNFLAGETAAKEDWQWLHPGAVALTNRALKIRGRPDFSIDPSYLRDESRVHWKTGTSQGRRDAWCIGFDERFTVGVWVGNLDNAASPAIVGSEAAAPIMFDVFSRVRSGLGVAPSVTDLASVSDARELAPVDVCAFSGLPIGDGCPSKKTVLGIKGMVPHRRCPYHHEVLVDARSGYRINQECKSEKMEPALRSVLSLPSTVNLWASKSFPNLQLSPPYHPSCVERSVEKGRIKILSPGQGSHYVLHSGTNGSSLTLPLKVRTPDLGQAEAQCFLNGEPLKSSSHEFDRVISVGAGAHHVLCVDKLGRADNVKFWVEI